LTKNGKKYYETIMTLLVALLLIRSWMRRTLLACWRMTTEKRRMRKTNMNLQHKHKVYNIPMKICEE
jgi:hypothetical protein